MPPDDDVWTVTVDLQNLDLDEEMAKKLQGVGITLQAPDGTPYKAVGPLGGSGWNPPRIILRAGFKRP